MKKEELKQNFENCKVIIIGFSNPTPDGVVLHTNIPARLKSGNFVGNKFWVSWDKIGVSLLQNYDVDRLDDISAEYKSEIPPTTPTTGE